ncbi:MlaD family protein [Lutibacter holmesii]|uniref:MlaD family protein n=1 Tax=Lutibacter holmesii TaxID=1137985 RepID=A0ABW3WM62_9FLAO
MEKSNTQKIKLGLFVITATLLLITLLYFVGDRQNLFGKNFKISAIFNNVNGLQLGNNVRYAGINVGTVKNIVMINDTTICVDMVLENNILKHIKKNALANIGSDGLVGSMVINIIPNTATALHLKPGDTIKSYTNISTASMLNTLNTTNKNAAILTSDLLKITNSINEGKGTVGLLLNDTEMALNLKKTSENLRVASEQTSTTISQINTIISAINYNESVAAVLLSDTIAAKQLKTTILNLEKSSTEINEVVSNLNTVMFKINNGNGTLSLLLNDTLLVKNIDTTMLNIKESSVLLNDNLEALKHSFLLKGYFKKQEKKLQKEEKK